MRPRIRTIKPEIWQDEAVGTLDPWPRLLFIGLITMADDEGRLRALPAAILGHVFPYDKAPPAKIARWLETLACAGLIDHYSHDGVPYVAIRGWAKHQKINRPVLSRLPEPSVSENGRRQ